MKFRNPGDPVVLTKELADLRDRISPEASCLC
jgi:hypothetical protein